MIVGYMWQILGRGKLLTLHPHPLASPKMPILNRVKVEASDDVLLLGITIDKKLTLKQHIENLCRKAQYI